MSVIFPHKSFSEVNDFYESLQGIQDNFGHNECFGKPVSSHIQFGNLKNTSLFKDMNVMLAKEGGAKKCFSSSSFHENEFNLPLCNRKFSIGCYAEDKSAFTSSSSLTSFNSYSSMISLTNPANNTPNNNNNSSSNNNANTKAKKKKSGRKKNSGEVDYRKKYKTELCKYLTEKGYCEFGDSCAFAHNSQEIRQKAHISNNYKTKKCNSFHELGYCPYGVRCQFIHSLRKDCYHNSDSTSEPVSYLEAMENPELWVTHEPDCICLQKKHRNRFPSFQKVSCLISDEDENSREKDNCP